jgi:hypothetical protein
MAMRSPEGVIRFEADHRSGPLEERVYGEAARALAAWREVMSRLGLIGRDPARYQGVGFGNASARVGAMGDVGRGMRRFLVTGSQTGGRAALTLADFCLVERYDLERNRVTSVGLVPPSSESLTHGAIYDIAPQARVVLHGHAPEIWKHARSLAIPVTAAAVPNGTPEMAREVQRLYRESALPGMGILAMGGHQDGVLSFGKSATEAGEVLVRQLARALTLPS